MKVNQIIVDLPSHFELLNISLKCRKFKISIITACLLQLNLTTNHSHPCFCFDHIIDNGLKNPIRKNIPIIKMVMFTKTLLLKKDSLCVKSG